MVVFVSTFFWWWLYCGTFTKKTLPETSLAADEIPEAVQNLPFETSRACLGTELLSKEMSRQYREMQVPNGQGLPAPFIESHICDPYNFTSWRCPWRHFKSKTERRSSRRSFATLPGKNASFSCPSPVGQVVRRVLMLANLNKQIVDRKNLSTWERVLGFKGLCGGQAKGFCFCWQHSEVILIYSWCNFG